MPVSGRSIEYRIVANGYRGPSIAKAMNEAAAEGFHYVDTMRVDRYSERTEYTVLMAREVTDAS